MSEGRVMIAIGRVRMNAETVAAIRENRLPKGNPLVTARVAALFGARRTGEILPDRPSRDGGTLDVEFSLEADGVLVTATRDADTGGSGLEMEALTAVTLAALSIYDVCKTLDKEMRIADVRIVEASASPVPAPVPAPPPARAATPAPRETPPCSGDYRPATGILVLSDTIAAGQGEDRSGAILRDAFAGAGCRVAHFAVIPDEANELRRHIRDWITAGVELIITSGGTGLGPRDITVDTLARLFDSRLPGIEQALHARGRESVSTAMLSRLGAGTMGRTVVIAIPGSAGAARDAVHVLIPAIFHAWSVRTGARHG